MKRERQRGGKRRERETEPELELVGFLCSRGLFVKAASRVTGLAPSASAVTGNYKQAECVTCLNAVAESRRGHRAHAGRLAGCMQESLLGNCLLCTVLLCGATNRAPIS